MTKPHLRLLLASSVASLAVTVAAAQETSAVALPQAEDSYFVSARAMLGDRMALQPNTNRAKNVILFVGDGMGVSTVTAGRIFAGQQAGHDGESHNLTIDRMPYSALSRTYTSDAQVADSAPTATAMTSGVKTRNDTIGLDQTVEVGVCGSGAPVKTIAEMAEEAGYATGVVSTARITHATPAAMYAHTPMRDWEADSNVDKLAAGECLDIATQLIDWEAGDGFEVILGGGRRAFLPATMADPEYADETGVRADGRDLSAEWLTRHDNQAAAYVFNLEGFEGVDPAATDRLLGLFEPSHMLYEADRVGEPSLTDMTLKAIDILSKNENGYVLMVEGGRIDHAHHEGNAFRALTDMVAFDDAIRATLEKISLDDTLVVVTADHSHVFTIAGYPKRNNPILGLARGVDDELLLGDDNKPYTTLGYQNGPGAIVEVPEEEEAAATTNGATLVAAEAVAPVVREDLTEVDTTAPDFLQQATVPLASETHGGEEVGIYAAGPFAHLFGGTVDQNYIFHVMRHSLGWDATAQ